MSGYRDYRLRPRRSRRGLRILGAAVGLGLVAALVAAAAWTLGPYRVLRSAATSLERGDLAAARAGLSGLAAHPLFGAAAREGLGVVALLDGDLDRARVHLGEPSATSSRLLGVDLDGLVLGLVERGDYSRARLLAEHAIGRGGSDRLRILHGAALNGVDEVARAREVLGGGAYRTLFEKVRRGEEIMIGGPLADERLYRIYQGHVKSVVEKGRTGRRAYVFDAAGRPLLQVPLGGGDAVAADTAARPLLLGSEGESGGLDRLLDDRDRHNRVEIAIDGEVQRVAYAALKGRLGAACVLDRDGRVLAATSRSDRKRGRDFQVAAPDPLAAEIETASVAKVPALAAALAVPGLAARVFPFDCRPPARIGGKPLHDARAHGTVVDPAKALAVSCNLAFAELGIALGRKRVLAGLAAFGFDREAMPSLAGRQLGRSAAVDDGDRGTAELASGLAGTRSSLIGAAAVALAVATGGEYRVPRLVLRKVATGGLVYLEPAAGSWTAMTPEVAAELREAMSRVVLDPDGTAVRALPERLTLAAKTGTASGGKGVYRTLIVGFTPIEAPRYAIAVHLVDDSRAEWGTAWAVKALVDGLADLEEERARRKLQNW